MERAGRIEGPWLVIPRRAWNKHQPIRLGDLVHTIFLPFARILDRIFSTRLSNCQSCARRRQKLNRLTTH